MYLCDVTTSNKTIVLYISMIITLVLVYITTDHNHRYEYKKYCVTYDNT